MRSALVGVLGRKGEIDAPVACRAIAAAEVAAGTFGKPAHSLPENVESYIARMNTDPDRSLLQLTLEALEAATGPESELHELWEESGGLDEWLADIEDLAARIRSIRN